MTVLSITHEDKAPTETWVKDQDLRHAYAYDKSLKLYRELGGGGFPHAALIDPSGAVRWKGHPAGLQDSTIEQALVGALPIPMWEWPKEASSVRKALQKAQYAKALEAARRVAEGGHYVDTVQAVIEGRLGALVSAYELGDYLTAYESAKELRTALKGLPEHEKAEELYTRIKDDKDAQAVIKAQEDVADLTREASELKKRKDAEKILDELRKLQQKNSGNYAAKQASELADAIRKQLPGLR